MHKTLSDSRLDAGSRALLLLSLHHGISDEELARTIGADTDEITRRREQAIDRVVAEAGSVPDFLPDDVRERRSESALAERMIAEVEEARREEAPAAPAR